ncbi:hypothetical protein C2E21_8156 [Chlorella sorokiniana]|uniref:Protein FAM221A n=1 Tax=Chlorella sorokiniana TaxID=3076 RepID=A0A2P6TG27_CHLSO|nr:hypothetical protein C2E21_8156 [Chlorella sorokiniana]|eukprot:PRW33049.1 hypothetical protein C2E21_8156 [Chlorella sorokiniana]
MEPTQGAGPGPSSTRLAWVCGACQRECIPIRAESRCLCGHRQREHDPEHGWRCKCGGCTCRAFFYIVAQGAWILRCRCKHKHTEHDPGSRACAKRGCTCAAFDSPWVCNCDHGWAEHRQVEVAEAPSSIGAMLAAAAAAELDAMQAVQRGGGSGANG